jgi:hypothetical protein
MIVADDALLAEPIVGHVVARPTLALAVLGGRRLARFSLSDSRSMCT